MKFKSMLDILTYVESHFFVDGFSIDMQEYDNSVMIFAKSKLGIGKFKVYNNSNKSFRWNGKIKYKPMSFNWFGDNDWMTINIQ